MLIVFEDQGYRSLEPLTTWRCVWDIRCGVRTLLEKLLVAYPKAEVGLWSRPALRAVQTERGFAPLEMVGALCPRVDGDPSRVGAPAMALLVNGRALLEEAIPLEGPAQVAWVGTTAAWLRVPVSTLMAAAITAEDLFDAGRTRLAVERLALEPAPAPRARVLSHPWDIVQANPAELVRDIAPLMAASSPPTWVEGLAGVSVVNPKAVRVAEGVRLKPGVVIDAEAGPVYIGPRVTVGPHSSIQGPASLGADTLVQPGTVIRAGTTIGPVCKVGGEIEASVMIGYANKQHDGFLGHAVVAEWCNLGAATTGSDLKNTYGTVRVEWAGQVIDTQQLLVGATIGDHTRTAIGTRLATGAMIGVGCQVSASSPTPRCLPHLTWLDDHGRRPVEVDKAIEVARRMMARRGCQLRPAEAELLRSLSSL